MSYRGPGAVEQPLEDVIEAVGAIRSHTSRGRLDDLLVFDAVCMRLIEIGEALRSVPGEVLAWEPEVPWPQVIAMRHRLAHRYIDTNADIVRQTVAEDLDQIVDAARRLLARLASEGSDSASSGPV